MATALKAVPNTSQNGKGRRIIGKNTIAAARPTTHEDVPCDEWEEGAAFRVVPMDFDTHDMWEIAQVGMHADPSGESLRGMRVKIVGRSMRDADGKRVFANDQEITDALSDKDARPILRGFEAVLRISRNLDQQVEHAVGNSDSAPSEGRSTD